MTNTRPFLIDEAEGIFRHEGRVSAALLQRRLRLSYFRAMEVIEELEAKGVVERNPDSGLGRYRLVED